MGLIAKKPCSFGGQKFFIGDEVPADLVADPKAQEKLGVIAISNADNGGVPAGEAGTFTKEQVDSMIAGAVAELKVTEPGAFEGTVQIQVKGKSDGENEQITAVPATPEELQQVFSIMQLNADDGAKAVSEVQSENVLILLHAADSRKTIKEAAKKQADNLFAKEEGADI